jgi:hypothetical protein
MPITPLHLGPGAILKAAAGQHMSLSVFVFCQITMDLEVLGRLLVGAPQIHGFTNTALGATVILVPSVLLGRPVCQAFLRWWNSQLNPVQARWLSVDPVITLKAAWIGGVLGIYSHVVLDALMHPDANPWAPFSPKNPFVGILSIESLNALCWWTIVIGIFVMGTAKVWTKRKATQEKIKSAK